MQFKKSAKLLLGLSVAVLLSGSPVMAMDLPVADTEVTTDRYEEPTREEEYMWFYRTYNGMRQKRLWSITYGRWVTDWIDIGPA